VFDNPKEAVEGADIVVFCLPVLTMPEVAKACVSSFAENCIVTDVGSTKADLVVQMEKIFKNSKAVFIGSHPIAGSEETGLNAARADLYRNSAVVVTPSHRKIDKTVVSVRRFWEGLGSRVFMMDPSEHDRTIALTSHVPHLVASMLVNDVYRDGDSAVRFCGTGFRDATRIAAGSEDIWHDIVKSNRVAVGRELKEFAGILDRVNKMIKKGDFDGVRDFLSDTRQKRQKFEEQFLRERRV
jgi:prephenate dehydrogenase